MPRMAIDSRSTCRPRGVVNPSGPIRPAGDLLSVWDGDGFATTLSRRCSSDLRDQESLCGIRRICLASRETRTSQHGSSDPREFRVLRASLVVPAARLRSTMATIAEAMPHRDLPEWRSHTDSPACRSQAGFFVVLLRLVYGSHFSIIS